MSWNELREMTLHETNEWHEVKLNEWMNEMKLNEMRWDEMKWNEIVK